MRMTQDSFHDRLMQYRGAIDAIDTQLVSLLAQRMDVVHRVGALKSEHAVPGSYIRPGREAMMVRHLMQHHHGLPPQTLAAIWRLIIGTSTAQESPLNTLVLHEDIAAQHLSHSYFSPAVPSRMIEDHAMMAALQEDHHAVAILPYQHHIWADTLPEGIHVFACMPFTNTPSHLACGYVLPEETGDDVTLYWQDGRLCQHEGYRPDIADYRGIYAREAVIAV